MTTQILIGDCQEVLESLPDGRVHCAITSPPYWTLRDYGLPGSDWPDGWHGCLGLEPTPDMFIDHLVSIFREVRRVLRYDGTLWLNLGDTYSQGTKWGGKSAHKNYTSVQGGYQTVRNLRTESGLKPKDLVGIPWRVALALQADGWWLRSAVIWHKPNAMPESVTDRPTNDYEFVFLMTKSAHYFYDADAIREPATAGYNGSTFTSGKSAAAREHLAPVGSGERTNQDGAMGRNKRAVWAVPTFPFKEAHFATFPPNLIEPMILAGTSEAGCCPECGAQWERITQREFVPQPDVSIERGVKGAPGQKPMDESSGWNNFPRGTTLVTTGGFHRVCNCDMSDPIPATILDPFGGAGTVGLVADRLGRDSILIELNPEYADIAQNRLVGDAPMFADVRVVT